MPEIGFLIIGAQKAGTTSLFEHMRGHPELHMPAEKEVGFFHVERNYQRGWPWYLQIMTRHASQHAICGEASVGSMSGTPFGDTVSNELHSGHTESLTEPYEEIIPRRIFESLPDVRLICILRDPVQRAYSHYRMTVLDNLELRSFDDAVEQLLSPRELDSARIIPTRLNSYVINGEYARILRGFLNVFPKSQLLPLFTNDLADRPTDTLAAVFDFLGVTADYLPDNLGTRHRQGATKQRIAGLNLYDLQTRLAHVQPLRQLWRALPSYFRVKIDRVYNVASYQTVMWNRTPDAGPSSMSAAARRNLISHFTSDSEALRDLLGKEIPWLASWKQP